ncbi:MAG: XdhC family protein [Gammaproteobacteria bacterium]
MTDGTETAALLDAAAEWRDGGAKVAVAVVVRAWNSAPRPPGSRMVVREDGHVAGSVSGGCVEKEVIFAARESIRADAPRLLSFGIADETAWRAGLTCGGAIDVLVLPFPPADAAARREIAALRAALAARKGGALRTNVRTGETQFEQSDSAAAGKTDEIRGEIFAEYFAPPRRAAIVGAVHIAQELVPVISACGFSVVVIDPRRAWATAERFPNVRMDSRWPDEALAEIAPDFQTAVVALTHDPKIDDPALVAALRAETGYVGALGSRRTHDKRRRRLAAAGMDDAALARIHAPVGADIGAKTAAEIAVSVAAEIVSFYRRGVR